MSDYSYFNKIARSYTSSKGKPILILDTFFNNKKPRKVVSAPARYKSNELINILTKPQSILKTRRALRNRAFGIKHRRSKHRRSKHRRSKHRRSKHRRSKHRR